MEQDMQYPVFQMALPLAIFACIVAVGVLLYALIEKQNELVAVRMEIPVLKKELRHIEEENNRLKYEMEQFESPIHLMELAKKPEFSHLKFPHHSDVVALPKPPPLIIPEDPEK